MSETSAGIISNLLVCAFFANLTALPVATSYTTWRANCGFDFTNLSICLSGISDESIVTVDTDSAPYSLWRSLNMVV